MAPATHAAVTPDTLESDEVDRNKATSVKVVVENEMGEITDFSPTVPEMPEVDCEETAEIPGRYLPRSVSESENGDPERRRSILRNPNLSKIRPMPEKRQSFDLQSERALPDINIESDDIERHYQRRATTNSLYSRNMDTMRRMRERSRAVSLASRKSTQSVIPGLNIRERKNFGKSFYWLAATHEIFRHVCMLLLVLVYTLLGALLFYLIESHYERYTVVIRKNALDETIRRIASEITSKVNDPNNTVNVTIMEDYIRQAYVTLLQQESAYKFSTFYKADDLENNCKWTFGSAFFFSMNVYTTTGYGSIAPESIAGKSCVIVYGILFVPVTMAALRDLGQWTLVQATKVYARVVIMFRRVRGHEETKDNELFNLPIKLCIGIMLCYMVFASLFLYVYDALSGPPDSGMDFFHSFYFSFISVTTIGLGDIMPNNATFAPIIAVLFFFGIPILKVVNRNTYICVENGVFGAMTVLENRLCCCTGVPPNDAEAQSVSSRPSKRSRSIRDPNLEDESSSDDEVTQANQMLNSFTISSIVTFMKSQSDVYGGDFGRVNLSRDDLLPRNDDNSDRVRSVSSTVRRADSTARY